MTGSEEKIMVEQVGLLRRESDEDDPPSKHDQNPWAKKMAPSVAKRISIYLAFDRCSCWQQRITSFL
jgi:hypothetical protein